MVPSGMAMGDCVSRLLAPQVTEVTTFQMGGNALGEPRGPIDTGSDYEIEFIIDADCPVTDEGCQPGDPANASKAANSSRVTPRLPTPRPTSAP